MLSGLQAGQFSVQPFQLWSHNVVIDAVVLLKCPFPKKTLHGWEHMLLCIHLSIDTNTPSYHQRWQSELSSATRMGPLLFSHSLVNPIKITQFEHLPSFLCCVVNKIWGYDICIYILHNIPTFGIWIVVDLHSNVLPRSLKTLITASHSCDFIAMLRVTGFFIVS